MGNFWSRVRICIAALLLPSTGFAWIPCFCGSGDHYYPLDGGISDPIKNAMEDEELAKFVLSAKQSLEQLYAIVKIYNEMKQIYSAVGQVRNAFENFSLENILDSWEIEDWNDINEIADKHRNSVYSSLGSGNSDSGSATNNYSTGFSRYLNSFAADLKENREYISDFTDDTIDNVRDMRYVDDDYIMRAIMTQEQKNAHIKTITAAASGKVDSSISKTVGISSVDDSSNPTIAEVKTAQVVSSASNAAVWSDMANSVNLNTKEKLNTQTVIINSKTEKLSTQYLDSFE